ncbi:AMP-binding protein [Idiomarina sp. HP20-50]|uniref:AMP-binding protein n=1 Tax=Idiomarina sp. HP20-50 TaxID=3070813 RepID=UPI00294B7477|nr:AMP-binding protein [Idiomarina sp. HP20-50]MDV6316427.1 AMP-binding protein [Idiomarina sp. HP20-50]
MSIMEFFERLQTNAERFPNQLALTDEQEAINYETLLHRVAVQHEHYRQQTGSVFFIDKPNSIDWVIEDLALLWAEKVSVPVPPFFTDEQKRHLVQQANSSAQLPLATAKITYTSGTTGEPKGVCLSAESQLATVKALAERLGPVKVKRHLVLMPLAVLLENIAGVYLSLWLGHEIVLVNSETAGIKGSSSLCATSFFRALQDYQPDSLILTPALLTAVIAGVEHDQLDRRQFKLLAIGGAKLPLPLELKALELGLPLVHGYGLSEFCSVVALNVPCHPVAGTVGKPLSHAQVVLDDGEILVSGNCMLGYLGEPDSWYPQTIRTGDFGSWDAEGNLCIGGRLKNIIVTSFGRNIDPEWLEALLRLQPNIVQAAIFGAEQLPITALIFSQESADFIAACVEAVNSGLPDYAQIERYFLVPEPFSTANQQLTGTGRLRREQIARNYSQLLTV